VDSLLSQIDNSNHTVTELINQVYLASREQTTGIKRLNAAVGQIDTLTQSNAATAEELAASSQEIASLANELDDVVSSLVNIVGARRNKQKLAHRSSEKLIPVEKKASSRKPALAAKGFTKQPILNNPPTGGRTQLEDVIEADTLGEFGQWGKNNQEEEELAKF
jgi:methyl-accepting chemotaxis protein